ncbi:MAG: hypothetical protein PHH53_00665 [Candidatus Nanoarchaeia archaeon]|nr:hypothetical protein [Candidatus Nanoarchaeia archaeon]
MNKEDFIKFLSSKDLLILLLVILVILFTLIYFNNKSFFPSEEELNNPIIITINKQNIKLNDILYFKEIALIEGNKNLTNHEAMDHIINEELLYIAASKEGFSINDKEIKETLNESLDQESYNYYKKYYIINQYKNKILERNNEKFNVTKEEILDLFNFMKDRYPKVYPPFEEIEPNLKEILIDQKKTNFLDEYIYNLRSDVKIDFINDFILDDISIYIPGMNREEYYKEYYKVY